MLTVVKGAGSMAEYAHASLVPWILGIYKRTSARHGSKSPAELRNLPTTKHHEASNGNIVS